MPRLATESLPRYLTGGSAILLASVYLATGRSEPAIAFASLFFILICATDTFTATIPNLANLALLLTGCGYHVVRTGGPGLLFAFYGVLVGFSLLFVPFLFGGVGAGDVKALAALGALLGAGGVLQVFLYTGLIGGGMALLHCACDRRVRARLAVWGRVAGVLALFRNPLLLLPAGEKLRFPYAAAIAFGYYAFIAWGDLV